MQVNIKEVEEACKHAIVIIVLMVLVDTGLFYAMPTHMEFDTNNQCPPLSGGCVTVQRITNLNTGEVVYNTQAYVRVPLFTTEVHEYMHTQGHDELSAYTVSCGLMVLLVIPIMMVTSWKYYSNKRND